MQKEELDSDMEFAPIHRVFTAKQAAKYMNISVRTLDRLRDAGEIGYIRMSRGCIRFKEEDCRDFLNKHYVQAGAEVQTTPLTISVR